MPYIPLSINNISRFQEGLRKLQAYENDFDRKLDLALTRLVDEGVAVSYANTIYGNMILFTYAKTEDNGKGYSEVALIGRDIEKIISRWRYKGGIKEAEVSPLLMAEFGSGNFADNTNFNLHGVGQGTFPGQKHAFEPEWHWVDAYTNKPNRSSGEKPTYPMLNARNRMKQRVERVFKEVFQ